MNKALFFITFSLFFSNILFGQNLTGIWTGEIMQRGKSEIIKYSMTLEQDGEKVFGTATSSIRGNSAKFEVGGIWDGELLAIQEVRQLLPENGKWCLKHMRLKGKYQSGRTILRGDWEAEGCSPGTIVLSQMLIIDSPKKGTVATPVEEVSLPILGKYVGTLSQSDREYGFYFEMVLNAGGKGFTKIMSDGEGGNATHDMEWEFDEQNNILILHEQSVQAKSVEDWPWCIKTATLHLDKDDNRFFLNGNWEGYIEGYSKKEGACAPGKLFVEQPILETIAIDKEESDDGAPNKMISKEVEGYKREHARSVEVDRVLEVKNKTIRVRVWDNGTIDGDVLTLFVNGKKILDNYRVTRRKHETIIELDKPTNYLILHAMNLGSISPNTVAVSVDDGIEEQVVIMSSNLEKSGAIMIKQFTVRD